VRFRAPIFTNRGLAFAMLASSSGAPTRAVVFIRDPLSFASSSMVCIFSVFHHRSLYTIVV
jgi:hypothetical protein